MDAASRRVPGAGRTNRDDGHQLRRRARARRRRASVDCGQRRVRHVVRRPWRSAANASVSVHRHPARRRPPSSARLRPRDRPARRGGRVVPPARCSRCATRSSRFSKPRASTWSTRSRRPRSSHARRSSRRRWGAGAYLHGLRQRARRRAARTGAASDVGASWAAIPRCRRRARRRRRCRCICSTAPTTTSSPRSSPRCWRRTSAVAASPCELLETPLITHAEVDRTSTAAAVWRLIHFWTKLLMSKKELASW